MSSNTMLSICIPTFNRGKIVHECICKILEYKSIDIEIVVCDNGSSDDTWKLINDISDQRLKKYRNETNMGFTYNLMKVIEKAQGKFACILSDEDGIIPDVLDELISLIKLINKEKLNVMGIVCNYPKAEKIESKLDQYMGILYGRCSYISGIVFNRDEMRKEDLKLESTLYPHIFLLLKLAVRGEILFSVSDLAYKRTSAESFIGTETYKNNEEENKNAYVLPNIRLKQLREDLLIVGELQIDNEIKTRLLERIFYIKLFQGVCVYDMLIRSEDMRKYYKIKSKSDYKEDINLFIKEYLTILCELHICLTDEIRKDIIASCKIITNAMNARSKYQSIAEDCKNTIIYIGDLPQNLEAINRLDEHGFRIDYFVNTNPNQLQPIDVKRPERIITEERLSDFEIALLIVGRGHENILDYINSNKSKVINQDYLQLHY